MNHHWWHIYLLGDALLAVILVACLVFAVGAVIWLGVAVAGWTCFCMRRG